MKINALEESADFATIDTEKLFSNLKSHELSRMPCAIRTNCFARFFVRIKS
jgi:hypothetical protein